MTLLSNVSTNVTVEARILEVGHHLGMSREAIVQLIKTTTTRGGRPALGHELRKLEGKYRRLCSELEKGQHEEWFSRQRTESDSRQAAIRKQAIHAREQQTIGSRLEEVLGQLKLVSSAPAGSIPYQSRSSETASPPPLGDLPAETYGRRALLLIRAAEAELDRIRFRGADVREHTEDRNRRLIREYEGFTSWEVSFVEPKMGHPVTVERIRREAGRRGRDGRPALRKAA